MDRMVADAFRCTISVTEGGGWAFEVSPSDAAAIASSTGLPIRVSAELWGRYSMSDPRLESNIRRIIRWIFRRQ
jgi:bifunctional DNase/RNase